MPIQTSKDREFWIRNAMHEMIDAELLAFLAGYPIERERLRVAIRIVEDDEKPDSF